MRIPVCLGLYRSVCGRLLQPALGHSPSCGLPNRKGGCMLGPFWEIYLCESRGVTPSIEAVLSLLRASSDFSSLTNLDTLIEDEEELPFKLSGSWLSERLAMAKSVLPKVQLMTLSGPSHDGAGLNLWYRFDFGAYF